jgi:hypothetical protein
MLNVFGKADIQFGFLDFDADYKAIVVHREWNLIFFVREERTIIAYDMYCRKVHVIPTLVIWYGRSPDRGHEHTILSSLCSLVLIVIR